MGNNRKIEDLQDSKKCLISNSMYKQVNKSFQFIQKMLYCIIFHGGKIIYDQEDKIIKHTISIHHSLLHLAKITQLQHFHICMVEFYHTFIVVYREKIACLLTFLSKDYLNSISLCRRDWF